MQKSKSVNPRKIKYSVIFLLEEPHRDFLQFVKNMHTILSARDESFEILIMANGTGRFLRNAIERFGNSKLRLKAYEFYVKTTQAVCLLSGIRESQGEVIVVCGSYQQIANESFNNLLETLDDKTDIISPWRYHRVDSRFRQLRSYIFNALVRMITKSNLHDLNCTVKVTRREVLEEIKLYGNMYRYLPILAIQKGFRIKEVRCEHYQEYGGKTGLSNLREYLTRAVDMLTIYFNIRFLRKPLRFFSAIGMFFLLFGIFLGGFIFIERFTMGALAGNRPLLLLAIFLMVMGVQIASVGLLGEIVAFTRGRNKKDYTIEKII
ncbi:MAG: glycosyltransferase [Nitrospinales bacterium]